MNSRFQYVLFDLDGTLTDPKEGICKSVQYALHRMNIEEPDIDRLEPFIGPPLEDSFMEFYHMSKADAEKAVAYYRERFSAIGLYENIVYNGIPQMLQNLKEAGCHLAVASSKPGIFVERILKHFHLENYFDVVVGSELNGRRSKKEEVVEEALAQLYALKETDLKKKDQEEHNKSGIDEKERASFRSSTAMVGDRVFDMNGAKAYGLHGVAAAYGYAPEGELEHSGAEYIAVTVKDLENYLLGESQKAGKAKKTKELKKTKEVKKTKETKETKETKQAGQEGETQKVCGDSSILRAVYMIVPLVIYELAADLMTWLGMKLANFWPGMAAEGAASAIDGQAAVLTACIKATALACTSVLLFFLFRRSDKMPLRRVGAACYGWTLFAGACLAMGLNLAISNIYMAVGGDPARMEAAVARAEIPFGLAVLLYVIVTPVAEELVFRWLIYGRISRIMGAPMAISLTAVFFGFFHGNLLQGIYAGFMGIALALVLYWSGSFRLAVVLHMAANGFVYLASELPKGIYDLIVSPLCGVGFTIAGLAVMAYLYRRLQRGRTDAE